MTSILYAEQNVAEKVGFSKVRCSRYHSKHSHPKRCGHSSLDHAGRALHNRQKFLGDSNVPSRLLLIYCRESLYLLASRVNWWVRAVLCTIAGHDDTIEYKTSH